MSKPEARPTSAEAAVRRFALADQAIRQHRGAPAGQDYERKVAEWRSSYGAVLRLGRAMIKPTEEARDAGHEG